MPEISELSQYQQSTDALAPLLADQGTWFDPAPLPPRPLAAPVPRRGAADAWLLSALATALPSVLQQLLATPPRAPTRLAPVAAFDLRPLGQSSPVGVLGWELPGARPPPPVPRNPAGADWPLRAFTDSTPLRSTLDQPLNRPPPGVPPRLGAPALELRPFTSSTPLLPALDQPTARAPASARAPRPTEQAQPLGAGIVLPTGWETAVILSPAARRARQIPDVFALAPLATLGVMGWEVPPLPPRAPAPIPRPAPLSYPPGTIFALSVNPSWGWEPRGQLPRAVPPIRRFELATAPGNFLFPPFTSTGWEPQGAGPRPVPRVARFEVAGPVGQPVIILLSTGWEPASLRPPVPARVPAAGSALPPGFPILPWGWDSAVAKGMVPGAPHAAQDAVLPPLAVLLPYFAPDVAGRALLVRTQLPLVQVPGSPIVMLGPTGWEPASPPPRRPTPTTPPSRFHGGADLGLLLPPPVLAAFLDAEPTLYRQRVRYPFELLVIPPTYPALPPAATPMFPLPPPFIVQLVDEGGPVDLRGKTVVCRTQPADRTRAVRAAFAEVIDAIRGLVRKTWSEQDLQGVPTGDMLLQFVVFDGAGRPRTYPGGGHYYHQEITGRTR